MAATASPGTRLQVPPSPASSYRDRARSRTGSSQASPWQLVEVSKERAAAVLSNTNSPNIPQLRTPSIGAAPADGLIDFDEALPAAALDCDGGGAYDQSSWWDAPGNNENNNGDQQEGREVIMMDDDDTGFDSRLFPGDWTDDLGHWISVWPSQPRPVGGRNDRRRGRGRRNGREQDNQSNQPERVSMCFEAVLAKQGLPEKRFNIAKDRRGRRWFCGNGKLIPEDSSNEKLVWLALDGRKSSWTRTPPEGPVYFDPPPQYQQAWNGVDMWGGNEGQQQYVYFVMQDANGNEVQGWEQQGMAEAGDQEQRQDQEGQQQEQGGESGEGGDASAGGAGKEPSKDVKVCSSAEAAAAANERSCGCGSLMWNPSTPEFVPTKTPAPDADGGSEPAAATLSRPGSAKAATAAPPARRHTAGTPSPLLRPKAGSGNSPYLLPSNPAEVSSSSSTPILQRRGWGRTPTPSPKLGPMAAPNLGPVYGAMLQQQQQQGAAAAAAAAGGQRRPSATGSQPVSPPRPPIDIELSGSSSQMTVEGPCLKWRLAEKWGQLSQYFKESHVTSPIFSVRKAASMQLAFYPNGSRTAEAGLCTVALTRGPDSAGIKFEFLVNGRSIGPKVCLGRRYMADYPKPMDDGGDNAEEEVVITMHVLEILGD